MYRTFLQVCGWTTRETKYSGGGGERLHHCLQECQVRHTDVCCKSCRLQCAPICRTMAVPNIRCLEGLRRDWTGGAASICCAVPSHRWIPSMKDRWRAPAGVRAVCLPPCTLRAAQCRTASKGLTEAPNPLVAVFSLLLGGDCPSTLIEGKAVQTIPTRLTVSTGACCLRSVQAP